MIENPIVQVENLTVLFHKEDGFKVANKNVSMMLGTNEWLGIMGHSGSGKSIMARSFSGLISGYPGIIEGNLIYENKNIIDEKFPPVHVERANGAFHNVKKKNYLWMKHYHRKFKQVADKKFAYIFQNPIEAFNPYFTVGRHIEESFSAARVEKSLWHKLSLELLEHLDLAKEKLHSYPHQVSGGELQRISVAMALAQHASVIIADECTTSLDPENEERVLAKLHEAHNNGASIVFITHSEELAAEHCMRLYWMCEGKIFVTKEEWETCEQERRKR